jgi:outer membrane protein assembly factor BamB
MVLYSSLKETSPDGSANDKLIALDKAKGKLIWEWSDLLRDSYEHFDEDSNPLLGNILAMSTGSRNYAIDLSTGQTVWRNQTKPSVGNMSKHNSQVYRIDIYDPEDNGIYSEQIMEADISTGNWQKVFEVTGGDSLRQGLTVPTFYTNQEGDEEMIIGNTTIVENSPSKQRPDKGYIIPYLINYNKTKAVVNYIVQLSEPSLYAAIDWFPIIDNNKVYLLVDKLIVCHDLGTGNRIWERKFDGNFLFSGALLDSGKIYANRDGSDPTLYCIDAATGSIIWETPSAGTSSPLQLHKGVLYFVGGSDGLFHCVNATNGKFIYSIKAPSQYKDHNDFFSTICTVDHETDKVYVASYTTAYCYPTVTLK